MSWRDINVKLVVLRGRVFTYSFALMYQAIPLLFVPRSIKLKREGQVSAACAIIMWSYANLSSFKLALLHYYFFKCGRSFLSGCDLSHTSSRSQKYQCLLSLIYIPLVVYIPWFIPSLIQIKGDHLCIRAELRWYKAMKSFDNNSSFSSSPTAIDSHI